METKVKQKTKVKKAPTLAGVAAEIEKAMKEAGIYRPEMNFSIKCCAGSILIFLKTAHEVEALDSVTVIEKSREGNERHVPNPIVESYVEIMESVRKQLAELGLTPAAQKNAVPKRLRGKDASSSSDALSVIMSAVDKV